MPQILLLQSGNTGYGLDIGFVQEMVEDPQLHSVPHAGACLLGAIQLHGKILPVIDLQELLGEHAGPRDRRVIVLGAEFHNVVLAVSGIGRMMTCDAGTWRPPTAAERAKAIGGVIDGTGPEEPVNLLDAGAIVERLKTIYAA